MIPITLLSVRLVQCAAQHLALFWKYLVLLVAALSWGWSSFYFNLQHTLWLRGQIGQRANRYLETARLIYQDQFPNEQFDWWRIGLFYCPAYVSNPVTHPRFEDVVFYADLPYEGWKKTEAGSLDEFERYAKQGAVYYITYDPKRLDHHPQIRLLGTVPGINGASWFEHVSYGLKRKKPRPLYIFKYQTPSSSRKGTG